MIDNTAQRDAPAFRLPALDSDFILGDSMRGLRFQLEYAKAEELLPKANRATIKQTFTQAKAQKSTAQGIAQQC